MLPLQSSQSTSRAGITTRRTTRIGHRPNAVNGAPLPGLWQNPPIPHGDASASRGSTAAIVHDPSTLTPLSMKIEGDQRLPTTRAGTYSSIAVRARIFPVTVPPRMMTVSTSISGRNVGPFTDDQHVLAADLPRESAVDAQSPCKIQLPIETRAPPQKGGQLDTGEGGIHGLKGIRGPWHPRKRGRPKIVVPQRAQQRYARPSLRHFSFSSALALAIVTAATLAAAHPDDVSPAKEAPTAPAGAGQQAAPRQTPAWRVRSRPTPTRESLLQPTTQRKKKSQKAVGEDRSCFSINRSPPRPSALARISRAPTTRTSGGSRSSLATSFTRTSEPPFP